jgi:hypothetical protein
MVASGARWREGGGAGVEDEKTQTQSRMRTQKVEDDVWMGQAHNIPLQASTCSLTKNASNRRIQDWQGCRALNSPRLDRFRKNGP